MPDPSPTGIPAVHEAPCSAESVARVLDLEPGPWHVPETLVQAWGSGSLGQEGNRTARWVFAGEAAAMLVTTDPCAAGGPLCAFGWLRMAPGLDDREAIGVARALLDHARVIGRALGCRVLRGPLTFSTWLPYRVLADTPASAGAAFWGEAVEPASRNRLYREAGLVVTDRYESREVDAAPDYWDAHLAREAALSARRGGRIGVRAVTLAEGPALLPQIEAWLNRTFARNPYFSPLAGPALAALLLSPAAAQAEAVRLVAEDEGGNPLGVLIGSIQGERGVLKTIAVSPDARGGRTAMALSFGFHRLLWERGITRALHAMMHTTNPSARMSAKHAHAVRHYVLYGDAIG